MTVAVRVLLMYSFFFFKQKTAYEMRISDWSSDVCSSDLVEALPIEQLVLQEHDRVFGPDRRLQQALGVGRRPGRDHDQARHARIPGAVIQIGRASCRERVCQYV